MEKKIETILEFVALNQAYILEIYLRSLAQKPDINLPKSGPPRPFYY